MYLYRALNDEEYNNYKISKEILATGSAKEAADILKDVALHVAKASSKKQKDCWISTGKELNTIIKEYAIPQGGSYNTGNNRKNVAVIDIGYWKNPSNINECYTIFLNGKNIIVDFSTITTSKESEKIKIINKIKEDISNTFNSSGDSIRALFDCSQTGNDTKPFNKMSIMRFSGSRKAYKLLGGYGLTAIQNGIAQKAKEVLCYEKIPQKAIVTILSPIQQDILYLLNEQDQEKFIKDLQGKIKVDWDVNNNEAKIVVNNQTFVVAGKDWMYPLMIYEEVAKEFNENNNINLQNTYNKLLNQKRTFLVRIMRRLGYTTNKEIVEKDGLWVFDFDKINNCIEKSKEELYDLALLKYGGKVYAIRNTNLSNVRIIGKISKKQAGIINKLFNNKILSVQGW